VSIATEIADSPHIDRESLKLLVRPVTASNRWRAGELSMIDGSGEVDIATRRSAVARITADVSRATTLRVDPA
jgi:hypothetical protein